MDLYLVAEQLYGHGIKIFFLFLALKQKKNDVFGAHNDYLSLWRISKSWTLKKVIYIWQLIRCICEYAKECAWTRTIFSILFSYFGIKYPFIILINWNHECPLKEKTHAKTLLNLISWGTHWISWPRHAQKDREEDHMCGVFYVLCRGEGDTKLAHPSTSGIKQFHRMFLAKKNMSERFHWIELYPWI